MQEDHPKAENPTLEWRGDVPVAQAFADPYFSLDDGLEEARHVFLAGNGLPTRFRRGFHIAELGFGTGLNVFAALDSWLDVGISGPLRVTTFEAFPMAASDMARALSVYPRMQALAAPVLRQIEDGATRIRRDELFLQIVIGDVRQTLPQWSGQADAWFLDGFAPARNPELWEPELMAEVARHTNGAGTAATYSAAGAVRRGLEAAGFAVTRAPGFGRKRHMTQAWLP